MKNRKVQKRTSQRTKGSTKGLNKANAQRNALKRNYKDTVFCLYYRDPENALDFYRMMHPDEDVELKDIKYLSIENILTNGFVNDIGFTIKGHAMILVEEQSSWTENIVGRCYLYQAKYHVEYFSNRSTELHMVRAAHFPKPEIYAVFTDDIKVPDVLSLADTYFGGDTSCLECKVQVIKNAGPETSLGQYTAFCNLIEDARKKSKLTKDHLKCIIDKCIEENIMRKFLQKHRGEVLNMMEGYYNEKEIRIALQKEHDEILTEEITKNVTESVSKSTREEALRQHVLDLKRNGFDAETIASFFNEPLDAVKAIWESC